MRFPIVACLLVVGCTVPPGRMDEMTIHPDADPIAPFSECSVTTAREPSFGASHVTPCSELELADFPPTSGTHYGQWADFGTYTAPVPWGFLIHAMEHGAVVIGYRCEGDCTAVVTELQAAIDAQPVDALCRGDDPARFILVPMPDLTDQAVVALAWEHLYLATCLDRPSLEAFMAANYAHGPENLCAAGVDLSASAWCP